MAESGKVDDGAKEEGKSEEEAKTKESGDVTKDDKMDESRKALHSTSHTMQSTTEWLRQFMAHSLGIAWNTEKRLSSLDLEGVAAYIRSDRCQNIITMVGAGISTSAGIPDFRSRNTGIYEKMKLREDFDMPSPESVTNINYFKQNPIPFYHMAKDMFPGKFKPTPCHYFLKLLNDKGKVLRHYTQNIDTLEDMAGFPPEKMVEAHGSFRKGHCLECNKEYSQTWMKEQLESDKLPLNCVEKDCPGFVKPDIVFFGQQLPSRFAECASEDLPKCDMLIIMGTALRVPPFCSLVNKVSLETPRLYVNLEKGDMGDVHPVSALFGMPSFEFDKESNYRDVFYQSSTDDAAYRLADLLGWGDELRQLVRTEHARLDAVKNKEQKPSAPGRTQANKTGGQTSTKPKTATPVVPKESSKTGEGTKERSCEGHGKIAVNGGKGQAAPIATKMAGPRRPSQGGSGAQAAAGHSSGKATPRSRPGSTMAKK